MDDISFVCKCLQTASSIPDLYKWWTSCTTDTLDSLSRILVSLLTSPKFHIVDAMIRTAISDTVLTDARTKWLILCLHLLCCYFDTIIAHHTFFVLNGPDELAALHKRLLSDVFKFINVTNSEVMPASSLLLNYLWPYIETLSPDVQVQLSQVSQYVFLSEETSILKVNYIIEHMFKYASSSANPENVRRLFLNNILAVDTETIRRFAASWLCPNGIYYFCKILLTFNDTLSISHKFHLCMYMNSCRDLKLGDITDFKVEPEPFFYERAIHSLFTEYSGDVHHFALYYIGAYILHGYAKAHPLRNIIETVFWRLTEIIQLSFLPSLAYIFREHVLDVITIPMNQVNFHKLVKLCNDAEFAAWNRICNNFLTHGHKDNSFSTDCISQTAIMNVYRFSEHNEKVGIETIISHILSNGLKNPFTNEPITWKSLSSLNNFYV